MANAWLVHVKNTMKLHPGLKLKEILKLAKKSYKKGTTVASGTKKHKKHRRKHRKHRKSRRKSHKKRHTKKRRRRRGCRNSRGRYKRC